MQSVLRGKQNAIWWGATIGVMGWTVFNGGWEWPLAYLPATLSGFTTSTKVANPSYILFLFWPLAHLPSQLGSAMISGLSMLAIMTTARLTGANRWLILLSYPSIYVIAITQIDGLILLGVALGFWAIQNNRPYWQGAATLLLCLKPQAGLPLALYYLWRQRNWRMFVVSLLGILGSIVCFGFWPVLWLQKIYAESLLAPSGQGIIWTGNSISLFPYGLVLLPIALFAPGYRPAQRAGALVAATILASPYGGYHSLMSAMAFPLPYWLYALISVPLLGPIGWWAAAAPLALILYPLVGRTLSALRKSHELTGA